MHDVCLVLEQVVDALDDVPLPEHEPVLHVGFQPVYKMYAPVKEALEKFLPDVSPVCKDLPVEFPGEDRPHSSVPVINVCSCETKRYDFPAVVALQVQLEPVASSHRSPAIRGHTLEDPVGIASEVVAHRYHRGIDKTDAAAPAEATELHEEHQVEEHAWHEFNETVIRDGIRKTAGKMPLYIKEAVMLEIGKRAEVAAYKYGHYIAVNQPPLVVAVTVFPVPKKKFFVHSDTKLLQNSSITQKISITLSSVIITYIIVSCC